MNEDTYELNFLKRKFQKLSDIEKQKAWLLFSESMTDYSVKNLEQIQLTTMAEFVEPALEHYKNFGKMMGLSSGFRKIDELTKGIVNGELIVVSGPTSYGKTSLAINITNKVALTGVPVLFVTLEMTKPELTSRFLVINGGQTEDFNAVANCVAFQSSDELNWQSVDKLVHNFCKNFDNGLIIIDHLHYFTRELNNVAEDLGRITKEFKKNAIRHNVPIILISHIRKTDKKAADINDLRGSSYIAQDADIVLMVGRNHLDANELTVKIEKNRNRGFDYKDNIAELWIDGITIYDNQPVDWSNYND